MAQRPDYYAILGISPRAEDIVIRAAYRALSQRYHPDRFKGPQEEAHRRMVELNAAYETLSNPQRRQAYDGERGAGAADAGSYFEDEPQGSAPHFDPLAKDWEVATAFYPQLTGLVARLGRISWRLAYSFQASLLESRRFDEAATTASQMESDFLRSYFGSDERILAFAATLIANGNRTAALALNRAIIVLGSSTPTEQIIDKIITQHGSAEDIARWKEEKERLRTYGQLKPGKATDVPEGGPATGFIIFVVVLIIVILIGSAYGA